MKKMTILICTCMIATALHANEQIDLKKVSEAFGNFVGSSIVGDQQPIQYDTEAVIEGIKKGTQGEPSPMNELELQQAIQTLFKDAHEKLATENLKQADEFLAKQAKDETITVATPGRLHYKVIEEGKGPQVTENGKPTFEYLGTFIDGKEFGSSEKTGPLTMTLDGVIRGLSEGMLGMKEGEKRLFYIHPEYAYGTEGDLPPNSLLIFEIKIVKADEEPTKDGEPLIDETSEQEHFSSDEVIEHEPAIEQE